MRQDNLLVQGAAIYKYSCTLHHKIQSENQHLTTKRKAQVQTLFCSSYFFHTLLIFPSYRKTKNLLFFSFFSQNYYICTSSKSRAKQCSETRTATKSLPVTELPTLYVLSIKLLKEIYRFIIKTDICKYQTIILKKSYSNMTGRRGLCEWKECHSDYNQE